MRRICAWDLVYFSTSHSHYTNTVINMAYTICYPSIMFAPLSTLINQSYAPSTRPNVCKLVTPRHANGILYPLSFQSLADPFAPSSSNGMLRISFKLNYLRTLPGIIYFTNPKGVSYGSRDRAGNSLKGKPISHKM